VLALLIQKEPVKGEIDLQHREMFKIFSHAVDWHAFFDKSFPGDYFGSSGYSSLIVTFGVNLPDPAGISITGGTYENLGMDIAENAYCLSSENVMLEEFKQA
jgi:hypothetical protein